MTEIRSKRTKTARTYNLGSNKRACWASITPIHYGNNLNTIDLRPTSIPGGWEITKNGWHYSLNRDGTVGFGGREGSHWLRFKLRRMGYVHWPTRGITQIGGEAVYNLQNLSRESKSFTNPRGDTFHHASVANWSNLWPGVDVRWSVYAGRLKEEIIISQTARDKAPSPTTPLNETYLTFAFEIDHSDIPKIIKKGIRQDKDSDFEDDGKGMELRDDADELLAFLPVDYAQVKPNDTVDDEAILKEKLVKRFYKSGSTYWLLVGLRLDKLANMPAGELILDPTVNENVAASGDDGYRYTTSSFNNTGTSVIVGYWGGGSKSYNGFFRFTGVTIEGTISTSYLTMYNTYTVGTAEQIIYGIDEDNPAAPTNASEYDADALTTASVQWDDSWADDTSYQSPSINTIVQELVDSYTINNEAIMFQVKDDLGSGENRVYWAAEDHATAAPANFYCEYSAYRAQVI